MSQPAPIDPKACLAELERRCAAAEIPVTSQRRTVLEVLVGRFDHPTVDQIYSAVAERMPDVSRATVYRSLETLDELGLVQRVHHPGSAVRFDGNTTAHHHLLCTHCGAIEDLPLEAVQGHDRLRFEDPSGRVADEIAVNVLAPCRTCASAHSG